MYKLYNGGCLEVMDKLIEEGIKVDCILCDPPYGTTACKWDTVIPFNEMWSRLNKLIKPNGAICLFGSEPFSSALRMSNIKNYKYDWIWRKDKGTNIFMAKKMPMKNIENIVSVKEAKFKKGLMRRIELLCNFLNIATNDLMLYTDIQPVFTRNKPKNEVELANMVKSL